MSASPDTAQAAFDCVLRAWASHEAELKGYLARQTADVDAADDLLQEVFLKAIRQGRDFCTLDNARAWLFQVARNALVDLARAKRPHAELDDNVAAPSAEERAAVDALDDCLLRTLQTLDEADRDIVQACDLDGQTVRGFAQQRALGLPAAKSRLLRARQRLRAAVIENCGVRFDASGQICCHAEPSRD